MSSKIQVFACIHPHRSFRSGLYVQTDTFPGAVAAQPAVDLHGPLAGLIRQRDVLDPPIPAHVHERGGELRLVDRRVAGRETLVDRDPAQQRPHRLGPLSGVPLFGREPAQLGGLVRLTHDASSLIRSRQAGP
ncbi:hypothetical protein GCM10010399_71850 [Dactylosporangium fulvum]|uniref:Uncharacterized protein n=1 Tax=Dactylosporangium fulvum TaxID=53359 RepID=A0ABY5W786_9ACTN|nr:hypothetical protein [Dactylosporangium fulvum]UWP85114.1 hypothetical protein Dfulv_13130 [Dactylosporangium fulvum]